MLNNPATWITLLQAAPTAARLAGTIKQAASGDLEAAEYLRQQGVFEALDAVKPGSGDTARLMLDRTRRAILDVAGIAMGNVVEGEFTEISERAPWDGFVKRVARQRFGGHILIGEPGQGKTQLARKLAYRWRKELHRDVEFFGAYPEDVPQWATSMGMKTLVHRMDKLQEYLDAHEGRDPDEDEEEPITDRKPYRPRKAPSLPPQDRIIVIDESSMSMSTSAMDPRRNSVLRALANCRHIGWNVVAIAQMTGLLALPLLGQTTVWVKKPSGAELETDRDNPKVKQLWRAAMEGFADVRHSPWWPEFPDMRAWCYVESPSLGGQPGYKGMVPFSPAPDYDDEEPILEDPDREE